MIVGQGPTGLVAGAGGKKQNYLGGIIMKSCCQKFPHAACSRVVFPYICILN